MFFVDLDAFKVYEISGIIYYIKPGTDFNKYSLKILIKFILFLSRFILNIKIKY